MAGTGALVLRGTRSGQQTLNLVRAPWRKHVSSVYDTSRGRLRGHKRSDVRLYQWQRQLFSTHKIDKLPVAIIGISGCTGNGIRSEEEVSQLEDAENTPPPNANSSTSAIKAYAELAKARLSALVVMTTAAGFVAAGPTPLSTDLSTFTAVLVGTALCSSSAAALNQIFEVSRDRKMKRTLQRPLVTGVLTSRQAIVAATTWGVSGSTLLWLGTDPVTTALGVGNIALYAGLYTALKPVTTLNTWVGAVVGAIPPVMGYSAAMYTLAASSGGSGAIAVATSASVVLDPIALTLASTLYLWQLPHFMALSYMYRADYTRGGFAMMPCHTITGTASADEAATRTANVIVRYAWYLGAVPIVATAANVTSSMFALEGLLLNGYAIVVAHRFHRDRTNQNARTVFLTSLWYLPCTLMLFLLHSKSWDVNHTDTDKNENLVSQYVARQIHMIRDKGREHCLHEQATVSGTSQSCPVVLGTEKTAETVDQATITLSVVSADHLGCDSQST